MIIKMYAIFCRETAQHMKYEGKLAAQAGHAYLHAWWDAENRFGWNKVGDLTDSEIAYCEIMEAYKYNNDARKITLIVDTVAELEELYEQFRPHMGATLVDDCGYTVFETTTTTAVGLGPIPSDWTKGTRLGDLDSMQNEIIRPFDSREPKDY